jgi:hypothetical protein
VESSNKDEEEEDKVKVRGSTILFVIATTLML